MSKAAMNLQDSFLNQVRRENAEVRVLLVNGTLLRGTVKGFDNFTLILNNRNGQHLVYKHAIAQIVSHRPHVKPEDMHVNDQPASDDESPAQPAEAGADSQPLKPATEKTGERNPRGPKRDHNRDNRQRDREQQQQRSKKEGFNTLDLSSVKLGDK